MKNINSTIEENVKNFIDLANQITVRILKAGSSGGLEGMASGFLYQPDIQRPPIVITAGHQTPTAGVFVETKRVVDGTTLCFNTEDFKVIYDGEDAKMDIAYGVMTRAHFKPGNNQGQDVGLYSYQNGFPKARKNEAYGFAVWNNSDLVRFDDVNIFYRTCCFEVGLELVKQEEHINFFKTDGPIKDHEYYFGASGSPVLNPEGAIVGILIGGTDPKEYLRVFRLDNFPFALPKDYNPKPTI